MYNFQREFAKIYNNFFYRNLTCKHRMVWRLWLFFFIFPPISMGFFIFFFSAFLLYFFFQNMQQYILFQYLFQQFEVSKYTTIYFGSIFISAVPKHTIIVTYLMHFDSKTLSQFC